MGLFEIGKHGCHGVGGVKENKDEEGERDEEVLFYYLSLKRHFPIHNQERTNNEYVFLSVANTKK